MAHLDDTVRAAHAAVELLASLGHIVSDLTNPGGASGAPGDDPGPMAAGIAIGITTGWAFAGNIGNRSRAEYTIMGDVVNMASRIMGEAAKSAGGGVFCDLNTREGILGRRASRAQHGLAPLELSPERLTLVKGKANPISITTISTSHAHPADILCEFCRPLFDSLVPGSPTAAGLGTREAFVGRRAEMSKLGALTADYVQGRSDAVICIVEARQGMGKVRTSGRKPDGRSWKWEPLFMITYDLGGLFDAA